MRTTFSHAATLLVAGFVAATTGTVLAQAPAAPAKTEEKAPAKTLTVGDQAPTLDIEHYLKGEPLKGFEAGKVTVVEFWATWCGPCKQSMPHISELQERYKDYGVRVVSISDEKLEKVKPFVESPEWSQKMRYTVATDPDRSVYAAYMTAAGQSGIPTAFVVGKKGTIEWIGHPMSIDDALGAVVTDKWDRAAFLEKFKKEQDHDSMMSKLAAMMRKGDSKGAIAIIEEAKKANAADAAAMANLNTLAFQVQVMPIIAKCEEGDLKEGMAELSALMKTVTPEQKVQLSMLRFKLLVEAEEYPSAAKALLIVADDKAIDADSINQLTWQIYEAALEDDKFPAVLIDASITATEKALAASPKSGMIMDTLAHLLHRQGNLDKAIAVQTQAIANSDDSSDEGKQEMAAFLKELKQEKADK